MQMAKRKVFGRVDIDSVAGPSEVLIVANDQAEPAWVAADMLSQAEHCPGQCRGVDRFRVRSTRDPGRPQGPGPAVEPLLTRTIACLTRFSAIIVCESLEQMIEQANIFASEHLEIQCGDDSADVAGRIQHAGAMFIGPLYPSGRR